MGSLRRAGELLEASWQLLPNSELNHCSSSRFREWFDSRQLPLALDELELIGREANAGIDFWRSLAMAAEELGLPRHRDRCRGRAEAFHKT